MNQEEKKIRREKLSARRSRTSRTAITSSEDLPYGAKCQAGCYWYDGNLSLYGISEKHLSYFEHRASPVPKICSWNRWRAYHQKAKVGHVVRAFLCEPEIRRPDRMKHLIKELLAYYGDDRRRRPQRSWKEHRKTQYKPND